MAPARRGPGGPGLPVDQFALEGGKEALGHGVVAGALWAIADAAHRGDDPGVLQALAKGEGRVLAAVVGVVHEPRQPHFPRRSAAGAGQFHRRHDQLGAQMVGHAPADAIPAQYRLQHSSTVAS